MAGSEYYDHGNFPAPNSQGSSATMRSELERIEDGFGKLPTLTGTAGRLVTVKADGTGLEAPVTLTDTTDGNVSTLAHGLAPKLPGSTGLFLRGDGVWGAVAVSAISRITRTSNIMLTGANNANFVDITTGGFTQTFDPALPSSWFAFISNSSSTPVTIPAADGMSNWKMYPGEVRLFMWNGGSMFTTVFKPFNYTALATETFIWPPGYAEVEVDLVGGGGGGGSGRRGASASFRMGGACGGTPARFVRRCRGTPNDNVLLTIGAAGVGGAAVTVDSTNGNSGTAGGNTSFGAYAIAYGGAAGLGGTNSTTTLSTSGSGAAGVGSCGGNGEPGGMPQNNFLGSPTQPDNIELGGGGTQPDTSGGCTIYGGAGGDCQTSAANLGNGGSSMYGVPAATNGALINTSNVVQPKAADAGARRSYTAGGGAIGGTSGASPTPGGNGVAAASTDEVGTSGAGGGSSSTVAATAGGNGGFPGGAGGGGGASLNGFNSGAGGNGAAGRAVIKGIA